MSLVELLNADALRAALGDQLIGNRIVVLEETASTNDVVRQMAADNSEGLVVIAEQQTAGRGQYGRRWESAPGKGLWLSMLLRPDIDVVDSPRLTDFLANSIAFTIAEQAGIDASIKPPNDVYIGPFKVAGVLVEMHVEKSGHYCAIAGLGMNINHAPNDFSPELRETAGSLAMSTGHVLDRSRLAIALLRNLNTRYRDLVGLRKIL